jgi:uncharacterized protein (TIRG00374 family)
MKKTLQLVIGIAISGFFIWLAFRNVSLAQLTSALKGTNWLYAIPFMAITMGSFYWRTFRWKILLAPTKDVPSWRLYGPLMIGFAFNNVFPARAGEFARPLALAKQERVPFGAALSTIVVERLVDIITLLALFVTMPYYMTIDPAISRSYKLGERTLTINAEQLNSASHSISFAAAFLMVVIFSFMVPQMVRLYIRILRWIPLVPSWIKEKLVGFIEGFTKGLDSLRNVKAVLLLAFHSIVVWFSVAFCFQLMSWGFDGVKLTFGQALAFLVVSCVIISIPSSPGFWGLYEFGGMVALLLMGAVPNTPDGEALAVTFTMVVHFLQWAPITAYGLWAAARLSVTPSALTQEEKSAGGDVPVPAQAIPPARQ